MIRKATGWHAKKPALDSKTSMPRLISMIAAFAVFCTHAHAASSPRNRSEQVKEAFAAWNAGDCARAEKLYALAADAAADRGNDVDLLEILDNLASVRLELGKSDEAERDYRRALTVLEKTGSKKHADIGKLFHNIGSLEELRGRATASKFFKKAIAEFKQSDDLADLGNAYSGLGNVYSSEKRNDDAIASYKKAVTILKRTREFEKLASACQNLAYRYGALQNWPLIRDASECAIGAAEKGGGLIDRRYRDLLKWYSEELKFNGLSERARDIDALVAKIDSLPPPTAGACRPLRNN